MESEEFIFCKFKDGITVVLRIDYAVLFLSESMPEEIGGLDLYMLVRCICLRLR